MYTKRQLKRAAGTIRQIARENGMPEEEVRMDLRKAMQAGRHNPDPSVQGRWKEFPYAGSEPTVEEFILWLSEMVRSTR